MQTLDRFGRASRYCIAFTAALLFGVGAHARDADLLASAEAEKPALIGTLERLVGIESGSLDGRGLARIAEALDAALRALGAQTERIPSPPSKGEVVIGRLAGEGRGNVLLIAHMDTVYPEGILGKRPFRIEGSRAYGPGVADAKGGIAVILHALKLLKDRGFRDFGRITVVFNPDEERGSRGSGALISRLAGEHDATLSFEPTSTPQEVMVLGTAGTANVVVKVTGKASHAGAAPEQGINAIVELADTILRTLDLDDPGRRLRFNWTIANGGGTPNVIPATASASANVRFARQEDFDAMIATLKSRVATRRLPGAAIDVEVEAGRPAFFADGASRQLAERARAIYAEAGGRIAFLEFTGGGTDAGYAALSGKPVVETLALPGHGYHSPDEEYIDLDRIAPRLYLAARLIMEVGRGR